MKNSDDLHTARNVTLTIYCEEWCGYLRELVNLLREKKQSFIFVDLRFDTQVAKELVSQLGNPLILPVLRLGDKYYEKPSFAKIETMLDLYHWRQNIDQIYYGIKPADVD